MNERYEVNKRAATSPEILAQKIRNAGFLSRAVAYFLRPFTWRLKAFYLKVKYAHHADKRTLNWDWNAINYNRIALVNLLLGKFSAPAYLEIGCALDGLFNSLPTLNKTGVDPSSGGTVRMTSDDFFASNATRFDVVFIDGLHTYEQVRRDTINALACLNPGGWIALHDMLPRNWIEQHVPPVSGDTWTGDVWKLAFELKETHGIEFKVLKIDHGVGVIKVIEPSVLLSDLRHELSDKTFSYYFDHLRQLPIIEWNDAQVWLRS